MNRTCNVGTCVSDSGDAGSVPKIPTNVCISVDLAGSPED